jgi:hypothetical protein
MQLPDFTPPQHMLDQMKAAGDHISANVHAVVSAGKMKWSSPDCGAKAEAKMAETRQAILDGKLKICKHLTKARGPRPVVIQLGHPEIIMCHHCAEDYQRLIEGTPEDRTCDFCRKEFELLWPVMFTYGYHIYMGGGCDECWPQTMTISDGETQHGDPS